ncbi:hypothetical protein LOZ65_003156 [Ophidiomyces ophidiicola]|nr:hypothetical protein LOZ65_003156 [Ophidiomyces ophidiicola]
MGRSEPPFLYDPPSHRGPPSPNRAFNPKAVTQESWAPSPPQSKKDGPLVNFNQHPDSFGLIATGRNIKTMSPKTKQRVKRARITQLVLRMLTLIGALGLLFCVICIKGTTLTLAWMIRVPPCVSIVHTLYGIYHLFRSSNARTPASSASYMLFAAVLDAGLIPLYVFIGIVSNIEYEQKSYGWQTLFGTAEAREKIVQTLFLACSTVGGLHLISLGIDLYLAIMFRKISKLPPDMNPLEDNLTSRGPKRPRSEIAEKHLSQSTTNSIEDNRHSLAKEPLIASRTVPFMHTRTDSESTLSGPEFRGAESPRSSYYSAHSRMHSRTHLPNRQLRSSHGNKPNLDFSQLSAMKHAATPSRPQSARMNAPLQFDIAEPKARDPSGVSSLSDENWQAYPSSPPSPDMYPVDSAGGLLSVANREGTPMIPDVESEKLEYTERHDSMARGGTVIRHYEEYAALANNYDSPENIYGDNYAENLYNSIEHDLGNHHLIGYAKDERDEPTRHITFNPLEMNPPTPRPTEQESVRSTNSKSSLRRIALADIPNPPSENGQTTPVKGMKFRSYGDLESVKVSPAQRSGSFRGESSVFTTPNSTEKKVKTRWRRKTGIYESVNNADESGHDSGEDDNQPDHRDSDHKGRVVSNTGIDLGLGPAGYGNYIAGLGVGRRREVSGKMAEEGRVGSLSPGDDSNTGIEGGKKRTNDYRAAGWARFKGL